MGQHPLPQLAQLAALFAIDADSWLAEIDDTEAFFARFGDRLPEAVRRQLGELRERMLAYRS